MSVISALFLMICLEILQLLKSVSNDTALDLCAIAIVKKRVGFHENLFVALFYPSKRWVFWALILAAKIFIGEMKFGEN